MAEKRIATTRPDHRRGMTRNEIREERRAKSKARKRRRRIIIMSGALIVALLLIVSLFGGQLRRQGQVRPGLNRGGPVALAPDDGQEIVPVAAEHEPYSTVPATSGPHWIENAGVAEEAPDGSPVRWGIHDEPLPDEILVANLKWGGIGLHYHPDACDDICVDALEDIVPVNYQLFLMSPYSGLQATIAVTSWRHVMYLDEVDADRIREFETAYKDRAPETIFRDQ